jgi:hypothetical protein
VPIPDDWQVGVADVVRSTEALRAGRYKDVNMAGASVVSAVRNALGARSFPFVFGGDGAVLAIPADAAGPARDAMAATALFVTNDLGLTLRVGMISVSDIRAAGHDVRVARYAASEEAVFAMFSGGGIAYAEAELKDGRIGLQPAPADARPDLTGLSCRWSPLKSHHGVMLSLLVAPARGGSAEAFREVTSEVIRITQMEARGGHPVPEAGPNFALNPRRLHLEARATQGRGKNPLLRWARIVADMTIAITLDTTSQSIGGFNPKRYRAWVTRNSDFRKFDDALRMTIDCTLETAASLEALLAKAEAERILDYGLQRQDAALMTCIVPSHLSDDHLHFLDGAGGGYAQAAHMLKEKLAGRDLSSAGLAA